MGGGARRRRDVLLVQALSLAGLALLVAGVYALVVLGIGAVPTSGQWTLLAFSMLAAAVVAVIYVPVHRRLIAAGERLVQAEHGSADDLARSFGRRAARGLPIDELLLQLAESLRRALALARAEVWTSSGGILELAASDPPAETTTLILGRAEEAAAAQAGVVGRAWLALWLPELMHKGEDGPLRAAAMSHAREFLGLIVVTRPPGAPEFDDDDDQALALLGRQAGLAIRNVRLGSALEASLDELRRQADELRDSRARVVAAGDAERRRIERDLHDGAQQHLVGLAVNLQLARELAASDPVQAAEVLSRLSTDVHEALEEVRDLAHGIYPPLLVDRGLHDAVRTALQRSPARGKVSCDGIGRYPADVEATVYFCCVEAIQNAGKHAGTGARVDVRIWEDDATLLFEVVDDGAGFDAASGRSGAGITNMRDRVGALGGRLRVEAEPGAGTRVVGGVPLGS
jgi:signal transduction histidine kinase